MFEGYFAWMCGERFPLMLTLVEIYLFSHPLYSPRSGCPRSVFEVSKILGFQTNNKFRNPPSPCTMRFLGGRGEYFEKFA
jgi:hypothetical protein